MEQDEHTPRPSFVHVKANRQRMDVLRRNRRKQDKIKRVNNETD